MNTDTNLAKCDVTGAEVPADELIKTACGKRICREEFDDNWFICEDSDEVCHKDEACTVHDSRGRERIVCTAVRDSNYCLCNHGGEYFPEGEGSTVVNVGWVSDYHWDRSGAYFHCDNCGENFHEDEYNSDGMCNECHGESSGPIQPYSCKDFPSKRGKGPLYYGVELEVEVSSSRDRAGAAGCVADDLDGFAILKEDGSLDNGFEIVTCPATLEEQRKGWAPFFAQKYPIKSWDTTTCGMHVHVSRTALSALQVGKLLVFVNNPENKKFVEKMAGRAESSWSKFHSKKLTDGVRHGPERYEAINTMNARTIEFRIFRGTINKARFFSNLEFVDALVKFTVPAGCSLVESASKDAFLGFVRKNRKTWPALHATLVRHGYLPAPKPRTDQPATPPANEPVATVTL